MKYMPYVVTSFKNLTDVHLPLDQGLDRFAVVVQTGACVRFGLPSPRDYAEDTYIKTAEYFEFTEPFVVPFEYENDLKHAPYCDEFCWYVMYRGAMHRFDVKATDPFIKIREPVL